MFDVEVEGTVYRESDHEEPGDERRAQRDGRRRRARPDRLLRPALPRAVPDPRRARRAHHHRPGGLHVATTRDHWEMLVRARAIENQASSSPPTRSASTPGASVRRALDDRGPVGRRPGPAADPETVIIADLDLDAQDAIRRGCPRWPTAARRPTAGPTRDGRPQREAGRREAAPDPRRRRARLRPAGLQPVPRERHRRRGRGRLRPRLPLLPLQGRGARHAVPRALERHARRHPRPRRPGPPGRARSSTRSPRSSWTPTATTPS